MNADGLLDIPCWYVLHTHPKQEDRAESNLRAWSVETFTPKLKERCHRTYWEPYYVVKHLFPGYIFARFRLSKLFHKIRFTRGVREIITFGDSPTPVDEEVILLIKSRIGADGFVRVGEEIRPGDEVLIKSGPLQDFTGVFESEMSSADRVRILLKTVGYQAHVVVQREAVKKISAG